MSTSTSSCSRCVARQEELRARAQRATLFLLGKTEGVVLSKSGLFASAGLAPDLFAGDVAALGVFRNALFKENPFDPDAFLNRNNLCKIQRHRHRARSTGNDDR